MTLTPQQPIPHEPSRDIYVLLAGKRDHALVRDALSSITGQNVEHLTDGNQGDAYFTLDDLEGDRQSLLLMWPIGSVRPFDEKQAATLLAPIIACPILFDSALETYNFNWTAIFPDGSISSIQEDPESGVPVWADLDILARGSA